MINNMWNDSEKLERMAEILQKKKKKQDGTFTLFILYF